MIIYDDVHEVNIVLNVFCLSFSRICSLLDGKGGGKKGRFQGRAGNYIRLDEANKFVQNSC